MSVVAGFDAKASARSAGGDVAATAAKSSLAVPAAGKAAASRRRPRTRVSSLTRRILFLNIATLLIPILGLLYVDQYRQQLIASELKSMAIQGEMVAGALGSSGTIGDENVASEELTNLDIARRVVRRLSLVTEKRVRLFSADGQLLVDSFRSASGDDVIEVEILDDSPALSRIDRSLNMLYDAASAILPISDQYPPYQESKHQSARDYEEVTQALLGEAASRVRSLQDGRLMLTAASPVQSYRRVLGALMIAGDSRQIDAAVRSFRLQTLQIFALALGFTVLLSLYLARTITRPIHRLARAADQLRRGYGFAPIGALSRGQSRLSSIQIPNFSDRRDEIGQLSVALRDMTQAISDRMEATERFAAEVAHEIKNPLTSIRSAAETVVRIHDPDKQRQLVNIMLDDVERLNRLITDISNASRLDAEMSRAKTALIDMAEMIKALLRVYEATEDETSPKLVFDLLPKEKLLVVGVESRLAQILHNIVNNAISFNPPGGTVHLRGRQKDGFVMIAIEDEGPGIPPDKLEAIFDRFYSARPAGEKFGTHSGLGLSISQTIAKAHGGGIMAENRVTADGQIHGARFILRLPAAK